MSDLVGNPKDRFSHNEAHYSADGTVQLISAQVQYRNIFLGFAKLSSIFWGYIWNPYGLETHLCDVFQVFAYQFSIEK